MKKLIPFILCLFLLCSCRANYDEEISSKPDFPSVVGGLTVEAAPEKIAVLSEGIYNIISKLSLSDKIVAAYSAKEDEDLIKIGEEYAPDTEKIIESGAEFLLTFTELEYTVINKLSDAGVRVIVFKEPVTVKELQNIYIETAVLFYGENEGETIGVTAFSEYQNKLDGFKEAFSEKSFVYLKNRSLEPSGGNLSEGLLEYIFGTENITAAVSEEELSTLNPDYIFLDSGVDSAFISSLSVAENLTAVSNGFVLSLPSDKFSALSYDALNELSTLLKTE